MRIADIIFQDLFGCVSPVRLQLTGDVTAVDLPVSVSPAQVQDLLVSSFYPEKTPQALRMDYAKGDPKVAINLEFQGRKYRIVRKGELDSLKLQQEEQGAWRDLAVGSRVEAYLRQNMALPDFETFWFLNLWRYESSPNAVAALDIGALDARTRDLIGRYRQARTVEKAEDDVKFTESRIAELRRELGQGVALEEKLSKAREMLKEIDVSQLSREDLDLLREKDRLLKEYKDQIARLGKDEEAERHQVADILPEKPFKNPIFAGGLVVGVVTLVVGIAMHDTPYRSVALGDILGFGACVWVLIQYFSGMERASVHQVRLESIKRRLNQVREEQLALQERLNHVLIHARVNDATDLDERVAKAEKLKHAIEKMEDQAQGFRRDASYQRSRDELERLEVKLREVQAARADLPVDMMSAYQLEADLESIGIDPKTVVADEVEEEAEVSPGVRLLEIARKTNQFEGDQLFEKTRKMWGRIAGHVLGDRFKDVDLDTDGKLVIGSLGPEQVEIWIRTRPSEPQVVWAALAIALEVNCIERSKRGAFETMIVPDPSQVLTADHSRKLTEVLSSAAKRTPTLLLRAVL